MIRLLVTILGICLGTSIANASSDYITLSTGKKTGGFHRFSQKLKEVVSSDINLHLRNSKGSCENLKRLLTNQTDLALVQYDIAAEAWLWLNRQWEEHKNLRTSGDSEIGSSLCGLGAKHVNGAGFYFITALLEEKVHWIVKSPVRFKRFPRPQDTWGISTSSRSFDFQPAGVYLGKKGSGSRQTSETLLGADGLDASSFRLLGADDFSSNMLFMIKTTPEGDTNIRKILGSGIGALHPLPDDLVRTLLEQRPYYRVCEIKEDAYYKSQPAVATVCVSTVLLVRKDNHAPYDTKAVISTEEIRKILSAVNRIAHYVPNDSFYRLQIESETDTVVDFAEGLDKDLLVPANTRFSNVAEVAAIPLYPALVWERTLDLVYSWLPWAYGLLAVACTLIILILARQGDADYLASPRVRSWWSATLPIAPLISLVLLVLASATILSYLEENINPNLRSWWDFFWVLSMYSTGNYDVDPLATLSGKLLGLSTTVVGLVFLAWFTATLTNLIAEESSRSWVGYTDHAVIFNFREDMLHLVKLLRSPGPSQNIPIHVVVPDILPARVRRRLAEVNKLRVHRLNPEVPDNLWNLRLEHAKTLIVLDGRTGLVTSAIKDSSHPIRVIRAIQRTLEKIDDAGLLEDIMGEDEKTKSIDLFIERRENEPPALYSSDMMGLTTSSGLRLVPHTISSVDNMDQWLAAAAIDPESCKVLDGLLEFKNDNAEIYCLDIPPYFIGKTWCELASPLRDFAGEWGIVALGILDVDRQIELTPALNRKFSAQEQVIVLAEHEAEALMALKQAAKETKVVQTDE